MNIIFVKHGDKYDHQYVNKLYQDLIRYYPNAIYWIYTENSDKVNQDINIVTIFKRPTLKRWWNKLALFSDDMPFEGKCLYFDLDSVIIDNPKKWVTNFDGLTLVKDFYKENLYFDKHSYDVTVNSSVMTFTAKKNNYIWEKFLKNKDYFMRKYMGIDRFLVYEGIEIKNFENGFAYSVENEEPKENAAVRMYNGIDFNL